MPSLTKLSFTNPFLKASGRCTQSEWEKTKKEVDMEPRIMTLQIGGVKGIPRKRMKGDLRMAISTKQRGC